MQEAYWDSVASVKQFTHVLPGDWLRSIAATDLVVDVGCGYGRTMRELGRLGITRTRGYDTSQRMIERGLAENPHLSLHHLLSTSIPEATGAVDVVLLVAVLTCIPEDAELEAVMAEVRRVLRPGGVVLVSDMPLQADGRNLRRYQDGVADFGVRGTFRTDDGAVVRHFTDERITQLMAAFAVLEKRSVRTTTMNGHSATVLQLRAQRRTP